MSPGTAIAVPGRLAGDGNATAAVACGGAGSRFEGEWIMRKIVGMAAAAVLVSAALVFAQGGFNFIQETLTGYKEVPVISTTGHGHFTAKINHEQTEIEYELSYADLEGSITQSHIHFAAPNNTGPVVVFLCTNLGNGPVGTPACPASPGSVSGVINAASVLGNAASAGLEAGNLAELIGALRNKATYVNVHTTKWPAGEIRSQIAHDNRGGH
jgi:hypothetical protein